MSVPPENVISVITMNRTEHKPAINSPQTLAIAGFAHLLQLLHLLRYIHITPTHLQPCLISTLRAYEANYECH